MKKQPTKQEKIFTNHVPDEGLISKIHKELIQLSSQKKKQKTKNQKTTYD